MSVALKGQSQRACVGGLAILLCYLEVTALSPVQERKQLTQALEEPQARKSEPNHSCLVLPRRRSPGTPLIPILPTYEAI